MKVIFITREGYELSGARVRCYNFARELVKQGIDAHVFSFADQLGAQYGEHELRMSWFDKICLNRRALLALIKENREAIFVLQRVNYHALAPLLAAFIKKNRVVLDCDDWNIRENPIYHWGFYPSSKMEYATRLLAGRADACIAASEFLRIYLADFNPKTYYLPTAVDTDLFIPHQKHDDARVVFSWIGTAYHPEMGENLRFIMECFVALAEQYGNIVLTVAGEGAYFEMIKKERASCRHRERIFLHPWIAPDKMPDYLDAVDVGLLPLIQDTKFNKAKSPTKLFEYMSMAKATIASDIGEARNIVSNMDTGVLARNRDEFISGMRLLIENPQLRREMGIRARAKVEGGYSLRLAGKTLADILKGL